MIHAGAIKHCSFCARRSDAPEVIRMIESPANGKTICNICVTQGAQLLRENAYTPCKVIPFRKRA